MSGVDGNCLRTIDLDRERASNKVMDLDRERAQTVDKSVLLIGLDREGAQKGDKRFVR